VGVNDGVAVQERPSPHTLAPGRIGAAGIVFFALAAATPFTVVATDVPAAYAHGIPAVPLVFAAVGVVLVLFSVGYVAMGRRAPNAGALYAFIARGLGRPVGIGSAWIALISYNAVQISLYGLLGAAAAPLLRDWFGVSTPWWTVAAAGWLVVALCGLIRVEIVAAVLTVLVLAEVAVLTGFGTANLLEPAPTGITTPTSFSGVDRPVLGLVLVVVALAFIGFETTAVYGEEARSPQRALSRSAYWVIGVSTVLYVATAWTTSVAVGPDRIAGTAQLRGSQLVFDLAADRLAPWAVTLGRVLLLTGLLAALISLHHTIARYMFALGRERLLPVWLGRTSLRTSAPRAGSLTQSLIAALVLAGCYYFDLDPSTKVFTRLSVGGALGILVLLLLASLAALLFLNRNPNGENVWRRFIAPALATVGLGTLAYLAFINVPALLGVSSDDPLTRTVPTVLAAELVLGMLYAVVLRGARPVVYAGIGLGGTAVVVSPNIPQQRAPGAHRPERLNH
jgi:amino acid transporter